MPVRSCWEKQTNSTDPYWSLQQKPQLDRSSKKVQMHKHKVLLATIVCQCESARKSKPTNSTLTKQSNTANQQQILTQSVQCAVLTVSQYDTQRLCTIVKMCNWARLCEPRLCKPRLLWQRNCVSYLLTLRSRVAADLDILPIANGRSLKPCFRVSMCPLLDDGRMATRIDLLLPSLELRHLPLF